MYPLNTFGLFCSPPRFVSGSFCHLMYKRLLLPLSSWWWLARGGWRGGGGCLLPCFCQTSLSCASPSNAPSQTVFLYCNCQLYLSIVFLYCILSKSSSTNIFLNCVAFDTAALSCNCSLLLIKLWCWCSPSQLYKCIIYTLQHCI